MSFNNHKLKAISTIGFIILILGLTLWLIAPLFQSYKVDFSYLEDLKGSPYVEVDASQYLDKDYQYAYPFLSGLTDFRSVFNQKVNGAFQISSDQIDQIINVQTSTNFDLSRAETAFSEAEIGQIQWAKFQSWGGWLNGRSFNSKEEMKQAVLNAVNGINEQAFVGDYGIDTYQLKQLKFQMLKTSSIGVVKDQSLIYLVAILGLVSLGAAMYFLPRLNHPAGIDNNKVFTSSWSNRGWLGMLIGTFLIGFYIVLYFYPEYMTAWVIMVDPVSQSLSGGDAGQFFLYGFIYTIAIIVMGARMAIKYRHSRYQLFRTASVVFFQTAFAFLIPEILVRLNQPYFDFKNIWPLDYDFFFEYELNGLIESGGLGIFMLVWGIALILIGVPVMVYFFGKRWYCSWVCGCGGLAETMGDSYRQLSDKSLKAWRFERFSIHGVLVFAVVMTVGVLYTYFTGSSQLFGINTYEIRSVYGSFIGAAFAGVVGTGFYPLMGNRVWCRFGCPLAAYLGLVQRFKSRFRITTNGGQCISCGNCSTYCEMGIDVRWYAQRGENIVRSSCVGCGVCSAVCPRGVLNLENLADNNRFETPGLIGNDSFKKD